MSEPEPEFAVEDDGARKSFWEHLKDLRVALVRSAIAIGAALVICLLLDQQLTGILEYPLQRMNMFSKPQATVSFELGKNHLGPYPVTREEFPALPAGEAPHATFRVGSALVNGQQVLTLSADRPALFVTALSDQPGYFSDNAVTLLPGRETRLTFTPRFGESLSVKALTKGLQIGHLRQTY